MSQTATYILDSDIFITAKNRYYSFAICPGFWDSLLYFHKSDVIASIDHVRTELLRGRKSDELVKWVENDLPSSFFKDSGTEQVANAFRDIMLWVQRNPQYFDHAKAKFATDADGWLVAYAMVHNGAVVTNEQPQPQSRNRVMIPDIFDNFKVSYKDTFGMLQELKVSYEWREVL
jgi:hypothetical protein